MQSPIFHRNLQIKIILVLNFSFEKIIVQYPEIASHTDKLGRNLLHLFPWDNDTSENTSDEITAMKRKQKREKIKKLILGRARQEGLMGQVDRLFLLTPPEYFIYNVAYEQNLEVKNRSTNTQNSKGNKV